MSRKVLVTGGAGFIGSHLVWRLLERGDEVRVLDNFSTGRRSNLGVVEQDVELLEGELRSYEQVQAAMRGAQVVFHLGALPSVPRSIQDPLTTSAVNIGGTLNVLLAARHGEVNRVVYASSSSVYGSATALPRVESSLPEPISPYAVSKLAGEGYCRSLSLVYPFETVCLRYFNVFGPRQDPHSEYAAAVPRFLSAAVAGRPVQIYGDGRQRRDFTYIDDVVAGTLLAAGAAGVDGKVLNIAGGRPTSVNALVEMLEALLGRTVDTVRRRARPAEVRDSWADIVESARLLGYRPRVTVEEGLRRTAEASIDTSDDLFDAVGPGYRR